MQISGRQIEYLHFRSTFFV